VVVTFVVVGGGDGAVVTRVINLYPSHLRCQYFNIMFKDFLYTLYLIHINQSTIKFFFFCVLIKIQPDATVCRYLFTAKLLYMFRVSQHPSSGVLKTLTAASGTGHETGASTSTNVANQATLEGSSCTDFMTCTGGCGYSF